MVYISYVNTFKPSSQEVKTFEPAGLPHQGSKVLLPCDQQFPESWRYYWLKICPNNNSKRTLDNNKTRLWRIHIQKSWNRNRHYLLRQHIQTFEPWVEGTDIHRKVRPSSQNFNSSRFKGFTFTWTTIPRILEWCCFLKICPKWHLRTTHLRKMRLWRIHIQKSWNRNQQFFPSSHPHGSEASWHPHKRVRLPAPCPHWGHPCRNYPRCADCCNAPPLSHGTSASTPPPNSEHLSHVVCLGRVGPAWWCTN